MSAAVAQSESSNALAWPCQIVSAFILGQTLFFRFTAAPESVDIIHELVRVLLRLSCRTATLGGLLSMGTMCGALGAHAVRLGIEITVNGESDGGLLFALAFVALLASAVATLLRRASLPLIGAPPTRLIVTRAR